MQALCPGLLSPLKNDHVAGLRRETALRGIRQAERAALPLDDLRELLATLNRSTLAEEQDTDGLLGAFTARGPAQMLRLSLVYALLDLREEIDVEHLQAAAAVWRYAVASVRRRVGASLTNDERKLLEELRRVRRDLTAREIDRLFSGARSAREIKQMVERLVARKLAIASKAPTEGNFRRPASLVRALSLVEHDT